jgi:hypothetical protein
LIDRRFAARRTMTVERESEKYWVARIGDKVLYRSPDGHATLRFAHTFSERTPGVEVVLHEQEFDLGYFGHSVRVPALRVVQ